MKVALVQLNSINDKQQNLAQVTELVTKVCEKTQPALIALPEMFAFMGGTLEQKKIAAEMIKDNTEAISLLKSLAKKYKVFIHGGSVCEFDAGKFYNTTYVINPAGEVIAKYRKINLFNFTGSNTTYNEGAFLSAGEQVQLYKIKSIQFGCAICFDLRFGDLFQKLIKNNVDVIVIPSAFTYETGKAHWEILCRARAIETQCFLIAPAQTGTHIENNQERRCWGHSMIVDPWGNIIAMLENEIGFITAELDFELLQRVRQRLPCR